MGLHPSHLVTMLSLAL